MPVIVRTQDATPRAAAAGVRITALLDTATIGNDRVHLERIALDPGAAHAIALAEGELAWLQLLSGTVACDGAAAALTPDGVTYLPLGHAEDVTAGDAGAELLLARVPDATRFDPDIADMPATVRTVDWTREPVLQSEHDARKRVYMATPALAGTHAFKGEMITYPPGTAAPEHHHVGAEHFQCVIAGEGTVLLDGIAHTLRAGDVLYNYEHEPHAFINESGADFVFVEFFVPGPCETIWSPGANVCAWLPTGVDSGGRKPSRDIGYHVHGEDAGL
jgi:quercetin dioxygenase-like cupin family protein